MRGPESEVVVVALLGNSKKRGFWVQSSGFRV